MAFIVEDFYPECTTPGKVMGGMSFPPLSGTLNHKPKPMDYRNGWERVVGLRNKLSIWVGPKIRVPFGYP